MNFCKGIIHHAYTRSITRPESEKCSSKPDFSTIYGIILHSGTSEFGPKLEMFETLENALVDFDTQQNWIGISSKKGKQ
jgi:hypothetical protein